MGLATLSFRDARLFCRLRESTSFKAHALAALPVAVLPASPSTTANYRRPSPALSTRFPFDAALLEDSIEMERVKGIEPSS
jgi:hypothetical protein